MKVGDKVKVIKDKVNGAFTGNTGEIVQIRPNRQFPIVVSVNEYYNDKIIFKEDELQLIEAKDAPK